MDSISIEYRIRLGEGNTEIFNFELDGRTFDLVADEIRDPPPWTRLSFKQCPHCPLSEPKHTHCPVALQLCGIVERLHSTRSIDRVELEVITEERRVIQTLAIQRAIASILDLVLPVCGCPITAHMKPLARFHLPLASEEEAVFRTTGMYLLAQHFLSRTSAKSRIELDGLTRIYEDLHLLNKSISSRVQSATRSDSLKNAITLVDMYCMLVSVLLEDQLAEMRRFFGAYLPDAGREPVATNNFERAKAFRSELVFSSDVELLEIDDRPAWLKEITGAKKIEDTEQTETSESVDEKEKIIDEMLSKSGLSLALDPLEDKKENEPQSQIEGVSAGEPRFYKVALGATRLSRN